MSDRSETKPAADEGRLDQRVRPPAENAQCQHPNKVAQHFTYGYRWHCPDCKAGGESWWD